jgi:hypothetical protein
MFKDTGMGRGDDIRRGEIDRFVAKLDNEKDPEKLTAEIKRIENGRESWLTAAPEVQQAVRQAKRRIDASN